MPNQFFSPEGDLENYFVTEYWLIDQYVGDALWAWGLAGQGQLGNNNASSISTPVTTSAGGTDWKQVDCGNTFTAAIKTDGTLWTWGYGANGRLAVNDSGTLNRNTPVTTFAGGTNWKQVSTGAAHAAAIKTDGTLWTWGQGSFGQLGNNSTTDRSTPVTTFAGGNNWKQVSCAAGSAAAIKTDGTLWTWGLNRSSPDNITFVGTGMLGNATTTDRSTPVTTFAGGTNWKQVSCGGYHMAAIKTDGTLWTWGLNRSISIDQIGGTFSYVAGGQLGNATTTDRSTPVTTFAGGTNWKQVSCGFLHTAAIKTDGTLWNWGLNGSIIQGSTNGYGQLGNGTTTNRSTPITTFAGGTNWKQINCGDYNTAAIKTDGTLWNWGNGAEGILGNASTTNRSTPVTTSAGGTNWKQVSTSSHTAAVQAGTSADLPFS